MKILRTSVGEYGPFRTITKLADRWSCDGIEYPFDVVGKAEAVAVPVSPPVDVEHEN